MTAPSHETTAEAERIELFDGWYYRAISPGCANGWLFRPDSSIETGMYESAARIFAAALTRPAPIIPSEVVAASEGVKVRNLDWQETFTDRGDGSSEQTGREAENGFGCWYEIVVGDCEDPDQAKVKAQEHFERCIRSALIAQARSSEGEVKS